jgi:hypothetical protein
MSKSENYLCDLGKEVLALAQNAQKEAARTRDPFQKGRQFGLYEILSLMKQQASAFDLNDGAVGLEGVDIESLLR